jgi:protein-disulfide isomerase
VERVVIAAVLVVLAVVVAVVVDRRSRRDAPTQGRWTVPAQLDRGDFAAPGSPWLVAVFTSATCRTCAAALAAARTVAGGDVVLDDVEVGDRRDVHDRYGIDAVPTLVVADDEGVVRASFVGPPDAEELQEALDALRAGKPHVETQVRLPRRRP